MATLLRLRKLGDLLREARTRRHLSLEEVADLAGIKPSYLWILEKAYVGEKRKPTVPSDEVLANVAEVLEIPAHELHAALGRAPEANGGALLVRETLARYDTGRVVDLSPEEFDALVDDIEDYAQMRLGRTLRQFQSQSQSGGQQSQQQKQEAA